MTEYRIESRSRFEGTLGARSLPIVGADRRRDRQRLARLAIAAAGLLAIGLLALLLSGRAQAAGECVSNEQHRDA